MRQIDKFSNLTALEAKQPYIQEEYYPVDLDLSKVILFAAGDDNSNFGAKLYGYYGDVIDYLSPILKPLGYSFAQIGLSEPIISISCQSFLGLSPNQTAYLIKRCALVVGNDNSNIQIASHFDKKLVALYGATSHTNHAPSFGNKDNQVVLHPNKPDWKPTYAPQEFPKVINMIKSEIVAESVLKLLLIDAKIGWESIYTGLYYPTPILELVPNQVLNAQAFPNQPMTIRLDYHFDENILAQNLSVRKCNVITNKEINLDLIKQLRQNIIAINYEIDLTSNVKYCEELKKLGVKVTLFTEENGENLNSLRLKFLDVALVEHITKDKKPLDFGTATCDDIWVKSNKFILSEGKIYLSKYHWFKNLPIEGFGRNIAKVFDHPYFWESVQFNYFFKQKNEQHTQ